MYKFCQKLENDNLLITVYQIKRWKCTEMSFICLSGCIQIITIKLRWYHRPPAFVDHFAQTSALTLGWYHSFIDASDVIFICFFSFHFIPIAATTNDDQSDIEINSMNKFSMTPNMILGIEKWQRINKCTFFFLPIKFQLFFFVRISVLIVTITNKKYHPTDSYSILLFVRHVISRWRHLSEYLSEMPLNH